MWKWRVSSWLSGDGIIEDIILVTSSSTLGMLISMTKLEVASWIHEVMKSDRDITSTGQAQRRGNKYANMQR